MRPKIRGWKEGIISEDLVGFGFTHKKGSLVRYKRYKTFADSDGFRLTAYEWHYLDENNRNLIRTTRKIIEGEDFIIEPRIR
jgi:hypothetical protein